MDHPHLPDQPVPVLPRGDPAHARDRRRVPHNVSSGNGLAGSTTAAAYGAAKAGVVVLTKYIATQYGKRGIRSTRSSPAGHWADRR